MSGIETITQHIIAEANAQSKAMIAEAEKKAEQIIRDAKNRAEADALTSRAAAEEQYNGIITRAASACAIEKRKLLLVKKQDAVNSCIKNALNRLSSLPDNEYFDVMKKLILKYSMNEQGKIMLSDEDAGRLPSDFIDTLNSQLPDGAALTLSDENCRSGGGCMLVYGDIEINCLFSSIFESEADLLQDKVHGLLFE